jgi:hypothetical protein
MKMGVPENTLTDIAHYFVGCLFGHEPTAVQNFKSLI